MSDLIPEDLVRWFEGKQVLSDRHNLPRIRTIWRVVEVEYILGEADDPWVVKGEWREFRTKSHADRYRDKLAATGAVVLIQPGIVFWPDPDEHPSTRPEPEDPDGPLMHSFEALEAKGLLP